MSGQTGGTRMYSVLKMIRLRNPDIWEKYIEHDCPTCNAQPGEKCHSVTNPDNILSSNPHIPRVDKAVRKHEYEVTQW